MLCGVAPFRLVLHRFVLLLVHLHFAVCSGRNMFFSSQPMGLACSSRENASLRVELDLIRHNELDLTRFLQGSRTPFKI